MFRKFALLFGLVSIFAVYQPANAHALGQSYIYLEVYDNQITGYFEISLKDVNALLGSNLPTDLAATEQDVEVIASELHRLVKSKVDIKALGRATAFELEKPHLNTLPVGQYAVLDFVIPGEPPEALELSYQLFEFLEDDHVCPVVIFHNWNTSTFNNEAGFTLALTKESPVGVLHLGERSMLMGFLGMVGLGAKHVLFRVDQVLFSMALLLPIVMTRRDLSNEWVPVATFRDSILGLMKLLISFSIAYSVTLTLGAMEVVSIPSTLVDSIIVMSIGVLAFEILKPIFRTRLWFPVFLFGMFHGFDFATELSQMGIPAKHILLSLLGFNIGIELGLLGIVVLVFPLLFGARKTVVYRTLCLRIIPVVFMVVAGYWFLERAFGIDLPLGAWLYWLTGFRLE